jgi:membrane associated rhomboid family serine protease
MNMRVQDYETKKRPLLGSSDNGLVLLVAANAVLFIILIFLRMVYSITVDGAATAEAAFQQEILYWFTLPANLQALASKPWTLFTCMFTTYSVSMFVSNMLWLWCFGYILQDLSGNRKLVPLYLYGGLAGSIFFVLGANGLNTLQLAGGPIMMGGGAAIMAIAIGTTLLAPNYRIFPMIGSGIPLWVLTVVFVLVNYAGIAPQNIAIPIAHIGGGLMGVLYVWQLRKGNNWGSWMFTFTAWVNDLFNPEKKLAPVQKDTLFYKTDKQPYVKRPNITQQRLDDILDKINQHGYEHLTEEEKIFLKKASKEDL